MLNRTEECAFSHVFGLFFCSVCCCWRFFVSLADHHQYPSEHIYTIYFSYCLLRWTLLFEYIEHECAKKIMQCNVSLLPSNVEKRQKKPHNIRRTNCRRFSIQLLRLAPRTTIYLFSGYTAQSPKAATYVFFCFAVFLFISQFDLIWLGVCFFSLVSMRIIRKSRQNCCQFNGISNSVKLKRKKMIWKSLTRKRADVAFMRYHRIYNHTISARLAKNIHQNPLNWLKLISLINSYASNELNCMRFRWTNLPFVWQYCEVAQKTRIALLIGQFAICWLFVYRSLCANWKWGKKSEKSCSIEIKYRNIAADMNKSDMFLLLLAICTIRKHFYAQQKGDDDDIATNIFAQKLTLFSSLTYC